MARVDVRLQDGLSTAVRRGAARSWIECAFLAAAAVILVVFRLHAFDLPLENDECNYAYIGGRLLEGDRLYLDVWDHQPPGVFLLFAGVIAPFGDAPEVFRWMTVVFSLVSLCLIYAIARRYGGRSSGLAAAMMFAFVSSDPGTAGEGCNREIYMNTLILAAWYFALCSPGKPGWMVFTSGWALGLASSVKTIVAVHWVMLAGWLTATAWVKTSSGARVRSVVTVLAQFSAGPVILWLVTFAYFTATGRGSEFVDAVFFFNLSYSGASEPFPMRFIRFFAPQRFPFIFDSALPLWIGAAGATVWLSVEAAVGRKRDSIPILLLVLSSFIAVCLPARFWPHYYYLLIAPGVIAVSVSVGQLVRWLRDLTAKARSRLRYAPYALFAAFPVGLFATEYRDYLRQPLFGITVKRYNSRDFWGRAQGENVRRVTESDDEVFVFGNDAEIYYYSGRRCASRYTMITGLQSGYAGAERRRRILMAELEERPPRLIVVLFDEQPFEEWKAFLDRYYGQPIGWDFHDKTGEAIMFVVARKDQPVEPIDWNWDRSEVGGWMPGESK